MKFETKCVQAGWNPKNGDPRVMPIYQSTTFKFDSSQHVADLFDLKATGHFYTRLSNPTLDAVEQRIAALEGGVGAMLTSAGQAASTFAILNLAHSGDHVISCSAIYGGTVNLFGVTLEKLGISFTWLSPDATDEEIQAAIRPNTKAIFGETLANPALAVLDLERWAAVAHRNGLPLIVDNTFPTPYLCRPFEHGVDIVIHATTKYLDGHAMSLGGVIVDSGNFDWAASGRFPEFTTPDMSYHGLVYTETFGKAAYIVKARVQLMRDIGAQAAPMNAFLLGVGIETLPLRMERHSSNALAVAKWLANNPKVEWVRYPGLKGDKYYNLAQKYMPKGASGVVAFGVKGTRADAQKLMDSMKLAAIVVHVADARTCVLHPASMTHRQLTDEQLVKAGISPTMIRFSVGIEHIDDIIADLEQAFAQI
ncbi:MAG: O-acetylhomoserine aminocarboxypropyltransferase/cysteine synthase [Kiritimatiellae bacterium]|nr:O-acetylhomoserine aminocarboxypropyltransferase/cysteine synthase [Kiritimatiellia bacterium]MBR4946215.1 O-acetylhomoserine aminocarboxypropyltransferase/cysteine synthase [Kiritimatiellia bacterium]MBR5588163.1 O-acetylhomoserine aminocarboxypropyltransferase/cysteine synthase [Kiritimatiellia bacterium]